MLRRKLPIPVLLILLSITIGYATTVRHYNLTTMIARAERIFVGKCLSIIEGELQLEGGSIWYTEYTFEVTERIKGDVNSTITFRQYGLTKPKKLDENTFLYNRPIGMPTYHTDQQYLLFLIADSEIGLTGPVGLFQGAFLIYRDATEKTVAVNTMQNRGLFQNISTDLILTDSEKKLLSLKRGPVDLENFVSVVKKISLRN